MISSKQCIVARKLCLHLKTLEVCLLARNENVFYGKLLQENKKGRYSNVNATVPVKMCIHWNSLFFLGNRFRVCCVWNSFCYSKLCFCQTGQAMKCIWQNIYLLAGSMLFLLSGFLKNLYLKHNPRTYNKVLLIKNIYNLTPYVQVFFIINSKLLVGFQGFELHVCAGRVSMLLFGLYCSTSPPQINFCFFVTKLANHTDCKPKLFQCCCH